jgi:calmodulin
MPRRAIVKIVNPEKSKNEYQEQRQKLAEEIFDMWDVDGDNMVGANEIRQILQSMGREASNEEIMSFLKIADKNNSGSIEKNNFMKALEDTFSISEEGKNEVCDSFKIFDVRNDGKISISNLKNILSKYGEENQFNENDINEIIQIVDPEKTGFVNYQDFIENWKFQ